MSQSIGSGMFSSSYRLPSADGLTRPRTATGVCRNSSVMQQSIDRLFATRGSVAPSSSITPATPGGKVSEVMLRSIPESSSARTGATAVGSERGSSMNASTITDPDASGTGE